MNLEIEGPLIVAEFELFGMNFQLTESVTVQWVVMIILGILFFVLGRNLKVKPEGKRQALAEMIVGMFSNLVKDNMGVKYFRFSPYIGALFCYSIALSLSTLLGFRPPTSDISVVGAWGIITFIMVQYNRFKTGKLLGGLKSFTKPIIVMLPINLMGEIANPVSKSFRHFGNILAGVIIGAIIYGATSVFFSLIVPVPFALYFDIFMGLLHAFVFISLTMVYVSMADSSPENE